MAHIKAATFENAQALRRAHPATFQAPTERQCLFIQEGQHVKVCSHNERFWVLVTENDGGCITGTVANTLIFDFEHGLNFGDLVCVGYDEIYDIL